MKSSRSLSSLLIVCCAIGVIGGCAKSKEDQAVERAQNRKPPAFVRLVNFSEGDLVLFTKQKPVSKEIATGQASAMTITSPGSVKVDVKSGDKSVFSTTLSLSSGSAVSVVSTPTATKVFDNETRDGAAGKAGVRVVFMSEGGTVDLMMDGKPLSEKLAANSASQTDQVEPGSHTFSAKTSTGKSCEVSGNLTAGDAYTVFIFSDAKSATGIFGQNSPMRKPTMSGVSAAG